MNVYGNVGAIWPALFTRSACILCLSLSYSVRLTFVSDSEQLK